MIFSDSSLVSLPMKKLAPVSPPTSDIIVLSSVLMSPRAPWASGSAVAREVLTFLITPIAGARTAVKSPNSVTVCRRMVICSSAILDCVTILVIFLTSASSFEYALLVASSCCWTAVTVFLKMAVSLCFMRFSAPSRR